MVRFARFLGLAVWLLVAGAGCGDHPEKSLSVAAADARAEAASPTSETWDAIFIQNTRVGYQRSGTTPIHEGGRDLVRYETEQVVTVNRFGQPLSIRMTSTSDETPQGAVVRLASRTLASTEEIRTSGVVRGDWLDLTLETPKSSQHQTIPWSSDILGVAGMEKVFHDGGLHPGSTRTVRLFLPELNKVGRATVVAKDQETVALLQGRRRLLRVETELQTDDGMKLPPEVSWIDERGEPLKTFIDSMGGLTSYRTTRAVATAAASADPVDFALNSIVAVSRPIPDPYHTTEATYQVSLQDGSAADVIARDDRQRIVRQDNGSIRLEVRDRSEVQRSGGPVVDPAFLEPNGFLQSNDARVIEHARQATAGAADPLERARRIERWVYTHVAKKDFDVGFATAAEVAKNLEGDCTEHSVLLAAMARAAGLPSRVAIGLVYLGDGNRGRPGFAYHMWTEVSVRGRWVALDGTLGQGRVDACHIKLTDSSLKGVAPLDAFLPVMRVLNKLHIEPLSWRHAAGGTRP